MQMGPIQKTEWSVDLEAMRAGAREVLARYPVNRNMQVCLTHRPGVLDSCERIYEGTGSIHRKFDEFEFCEFNREFDSTYFREFYEEAAKKFQIGRMRLALLPPHQCYSMHIDLSPVRYHVAIETNPYAFMAYYQDRMIHIPADGFVYRMDTGVRHSAFNGGEQPRIHLVVEMREKSAH